MKRDRDINEAPDLRSVSVIDRTCLGIARWGSFARCSGQFSGARAALRGVIVRDARE